MTVSNRFLNIDVFIQFFVPLACHPYQGHYRVHTNMSPTCGPPDSLYMYKALYCTPLE